jgi:23S rRNA (guanosine2251-2'-O)-methyltransferase
MKLNAKQLRVTKPVEGQMGDIKRNRVWIVLDNVMDTYNIGSIFRLADGVAAQEMVLCGGTERPPSSRIHKAAVGTEEWVPWRYFEKTTEAIDQLRKQNPGIKIIAVEQDERAISIYNDQFTLYKDKPVALVVGHETDGVSREVLGKCDTIVEIPMWGVNKSLNVVVSTGIALYRILG